MGSRMDLTFAEVTQFLVYDIVSRVYPRARGQGIFKLDINLSFNSTGSTQEDLSQPRPNVTERLLTGTHRIKSNNTKPHRPLKWAGLMNSLELYIGPYWLDFNLEIKLFG